MAVLNIYRVKLSGDTLLWAVVYGVARTKEEAAEKAISMYVDEYPNVAIDRVSFLEECKFLP